MGDYSRRMRAVIGHKCNWVSPARPTLASAAEIRKVIVPAGAQLSGHLMTLWALVLLPSQLIPNRMQIIRELYLAAERPLLNQLLANLGTCLALLGAYLLYRMLGEYFNCLLLATMAALSLQRCHRDWARALVAFFYGPQQSFIRSSQLFSLVASLRQKSLGGALAEIDVLKLLLFSAFSSVARWGLVFVSLVLLIDFAARLVLTGLKGVWLRRVSKPSQEVRESVDKLVAGALTLGIIVGVAGTMLLVGGLVAKDLLRVYRWIRQSDNLQFALPLLQAANSTFHSYTAHLDLHNLTNGLLPEAEFTSSPAFRGCLEAAKGSLQLLGEGLSETLGWGYCLVSLLHSRYDFELGATLRKLGDLTTNLSGAIMKGLGIGLGLVFQLLMVGSDLASKAVVFCGAFYYLVIELQAEQLVQKLSIKRESREIIKNYLEACSSGVILGAALILGRHVFFTWVLLDAFDATDCNFLLAVAVGTMALFPLYNPLWGVLPVAGWHLQRGGVSAGLGLLTMFWWLSSSIFQREYGKFSWSNRFTVSLSMFLAMLEFGVMGVVYGPLITGLLNIISSLIT